MPQTIVKNSILIYKDKIAKVVLPERVKAMVKAFPGVEGEYSYAPSDIDHQTVAPAFDDPDVGYVVALIIKFMQSVRAWRNFTLPMIAKQTDETGGRRVTFEVMDKLRQQGYLAHRGIYYWLTERLIDHCYNNAPSAS